MEYKIKTKIPFPLVKLSVNIRFAKVQKPSGIGYIILALIKDAKDRHEKLGDILSRFGVPKDLQFIFADEIEVLLNRQILQVQNGSPYYRTYFEDYTIGGFAFTENGERMFREGAIPMGDEGVKQIEIYYNPLTGEFQFQLPSGTKTKRLDQSESLPADLMDKVEVDYSGLKEFIIDSAKSAELKKEERVLECEIKSTEYLCTAIEDNLEFQVDEDGAEVAFKISGAADFYEKYYTTQMLERAFDEKKKFSFDVQAFVAKGFKGFKSLSAIHLPEDYKKQYDLTAKFVLSKDGGKIIIRRGGTTTALNGKAILAAAEAVYPNWSFIAIDGKEMRYYTATRVTLTERVLGKPVSVNLLVEQKFDAGEKQRILGAIFAECKLQDIKAEICMIINTLASMDAESNHIEEYMDSVMAQSKDRAKQAEALGIAINAFNGEQWGELANKYAGQIFSGILTEITKENAAYQVKIARMLGPDENDLFNAVADRIREKTKTTEELFVALTGAGFDVNKALGVANIVEAYIAKILSGSTGLPKSSLSDSFEGLAYNLNDLKKNLGINSTVKYAFRDGYNIDDFVKDFKAYAEKLKGLLKYREFARDGFAELAKYESIMQPVFDYIMVERNASSKPEQITESYIRSKISNGDWNRAICDMHIRLEWLLAKVLKAPKEKALDLIDRAKKEKLIAVDTADLLHELRKFRNQLQHPSQEPLVYDRVKISAWADALFAIKEPDGKGNKK